MVVPPPPPPTYILGATSIPKGGGYHYARPVDLDSFRTSFFQLKIFLGFSFIGIMFLHLGFPLPYGERQPNFDMTDILIIFTIWREREPNPDMTDILIIFSTLAPRCKLRM